jgi:hypothetical protein
MDSYLLDTTLDQMDDIPVTVCSPPQAMGL